MTMVPERTERRAERGEHRGGYGRETTRPRRARGGPAGDPERLARGLGLFSLGLGLAQVVAPRGVARMIGLEDDDNNRDTMFACGLREITSGVGLLSRPQSAGWAWTRVGGDVMDLALLGSALGSPNTNKTRVAAATAAVVGVTALDVMAGSGLSARGDGGLAGRLAGGSAAGTAGAMGIHVTKQVTVNKPPAECYAFWKDFRNLPRFMSHLESVEVLDERHSRWTAKAPAGGTVTWDAETVFDRPNELIGWRSLEGADVPNTGSVRFTPAPGGRGTEIIVELRYDPPGGRVGAAIAKLFGEEPSQQVGGDLRRFKQVMELGEVFRSDASVHRGMHPARPPEGAVPLPPTTGGIGEGGLR